MTSRLGGWLRANVKSDSNGEAAAAAATAAAEKERLDLEDSLLHAQMIMNDDIDGAYEALKKGNSSYHRLGAAVAFFMRSVLGMEKQIMAQTTDMLNECENKTWDDIKAAEKRGKRGDSIYPPGTEYELIKAETQLMGAVVGVLHESLVEAMKSFYKLRKAYLTLDGIIKIENAVIGEAKVGEGLAHTATPLNGTTSTPKDTDEESETFADAKEALSQPQTPAESTPPSTSITTPDRSSQDEDQTPKKPANITTTLPIHPKANSAVSTKDNDGTDDINFTDPVDIFIHSGTNMCFGVLMLMLTLVPPSFAKILSVVGFRGDRAQGVRMLWRSAAHDNINGAVSGMSLLGYYNGLLGTVDILPAPQDYDDTAETVGAPKEKCERLLATMRQRYPDSRLWQVEESRSLASEGDLRGAITLLKSGARPKMKQIAALNDFELALNAMFIQDWPLMRDSFLGCAETNDWSPALYWFIAGCANVELYRDAKQAGDEDEARRQKKNADAYLRKAPTLAGKKRFMASKLPFETFLQRRLQRWEERAAEMKIDMVDAIGPCPAVELAYMWNGTKKMNETDLANAVRNLSWDRVTCGEENLKKMKAEVDEMGVWTVCMAAVMRRQGQYDAAKELLTTHVTKHDRSVFKGATKSDYVLPAAEYELGAIAWAECSNPPEGIENEKEYRKKKMQECEKHLEVVKNWESYVLDMRIGLKVQSGFETIKWFKGKMSWAS